MLTFESVGTMKEKTKLMEGWISEWSESIKEWAQGMRFEQERLVWLTCYGVPLNLWSNKTFNSIGRSWEEVVGIDDDIARMNSFHSGKVRIATKCMESINTTITLSCKGITYPVKVCEEQAVISKVVYQQCKCYSEQNENENQTSNGDEQEQRSKVGSKKVNDGADVEGHVGGELAIDGAETVGGMGVRNDDYTDIDGHDSWLSMSRVEESVMNIGKTVGVQLQNGVNGRSVRGKDNQISAKTYTDSK